MTRTLFVSNDPALFDENSSVRARMRTYAAALGTLHIISQAPRGARPIVEGSLHLHPIHVPKFFRVRSLAKKARDLIDAEAIQVVSAQDPFEHGVAALRATKGTSAKLHVQVHTDFLSPWFTRSGNWRSPKVRMPFLNRLRVRMADNVLREADGIRVVSERIKASLDKQYGSAIVEPSVIPIGVSADLPPAVPLPTRPFTFTLIAVGRLEPEKRIEDILAALALVVPKYPMIGLCIVGEGRERRALEKMVQSLKLENHVRFLGARAEAWGLMQSAQAFIQASAYEGYGRTLIEAALAKVPIITTDVGLVGEVFKGYEDVLAAPVADPTELSLSIVSVIENHDLRFNLITHAETTAREHLQKVGNTEVRFTDELKSLATA